MTSLFSRKLSNDAEVRRIEMLYQRLPSGAVAALIGVFLCFVVLFGVIGLETLKGWTAYMLSVWAVRIWTRHMFGKADLKSGSIRRWEWILAGGAFLTSLGWAALLGPLYPPPTSPDAQTFIVLAVVVIVFTGAVVLAMSNISFWLFVLPVLLPVFANRTIGFGHQAPWVLPVAVGCVAILILVQRTLYRSAIDNLKRSTEAESLLAEQQAIFESSPVGIVVIDNKQVLKCNARLAEMLGRRIQDLTTASLHEHFVSKEEADQFFVDRASAFDKGRLAQGMYRLRRADGSELWAEFSGRKMPGGPSNSVWMIADVTMRVATDRRSPLREPVAPKELDVEPQ
jgi:PAS domain S-box-containing protein